MKRKAGLVERVLVTGAAGHLGEAMMRSLPDYGLSPLGLDQRAGVDLVGDIADPSVVAGAMDGVSAVFHTATLHKPHVATHARQAFVDTNITGTLNILEAAAARRIPVIFTSTTSAFGHALRPGPEGPAVWVEEAVVPVPRNIYGVTKTAAEDLCHLMHRKTGVQVIALRVSRFFPEEDDDPAVRAAFPGENAKANEFLFRRVEISDVVSAHVAALHAVAGIGFGRYIISATTPFAPGDLAQLWADAPAVVARYMPDYAGIYAELGWQMHPRIGRVYDNAAARRDLGWQPVYDFAHVLGQLRAGQRIGSPLAHAIGAKGYHDQVFDEGPYPVEPEA